MAAAKKADDAGGQLSQMMSALIMNLEPMRQGFVGMAGGSFQTVKDNIHADLIEITKALDEVAEGIRSAGRDFDVSDSEAQNEVAKAAQDAGSIVGRLRGGATG
jgi:uncharacterized protein YukE